MNPDDAIYVGLENIESWTGRLLLEDQPEFVDSAVAAFEAGDVLFGKLRPYLAKAACPHFRGVCTSEILPLRPEPGYSQGYLMYTFLSEPFIRWLDSLTYGAKMPRLSPEQIGNSFVLVPPKPEQDAIVSFLDYEMARIDGLIEKNEQLIQLLQERRTAVISRAVTKGFDPTVAFRDSGIDWLGEIPAHWTVAPLYSRYEVTLGKMLDGKRVTGQYLAPYLRNVDVQWDRVNVEALPQMDFSPEERSRYRLRSGDILICEGGEVGRTAVWNGELEECYYQKAIHRARPIAPSEHPRYLYYLMHAAAHLGVFVAGGNPNTIDHLTEITLRHYRLPFPPLEEQRAIVKSLDGAIGKIESLQGKVREIIKGLHEYRRAGISAAVTGKIDVRKEVT